jgi:hypothetical protein
MSKAQQQVPRIVAKAERILQAQALHSQFAVSTSQNTTTTCQAAWQYFLSLENSTEYSVYRSFHTPSQARSRKDTQDGHKLKPPVLLLGHRCSVSSAPSARGPICKGNSWGMKTLTASAAEP